METIGMLLVETAYKPNRLWQTLAFIIFPFILFLVGLNVVEIGLSVFWGLP
jgi:hypothetical protein